MEAEKPAEESDREEEMTPEKHKKKELAPSGAESLTVSRVQDAIKRTLKAQPGDKHLEVVQELRDALSLTSEKKFRAAVEKSTGDSELADTLLMVADPDETDNANAVYNLSSAYNLIEHEATAVDALELASDMGSSVASIVRMRLALEDEEFDRVDEKYLRSALSDDETVSLAAVTLGWLYVDRDGRSDDEVLKLLEPYANDDDDAAMALAQVLMGRARYDEARAILTKLVANGHYGSAILLGNLLSDHFYDDRLAEEAYLSGIETGDAFAAYNLAVLLSGNGRNEEAAYWWGYAAERGDEDAQAALADIRAIEG